MYYMYYMYIHIIRSDDSIFDTVFILFFYSNHLIVRLQIYLYIYAKFKSREFNRNLYNM